MPFLQLAPIANAITLVRLLVPINGHSIDGRADREVVVIYSDPLRHESRRLRPPLRTMPKCKRAPYTSPYDACGPHRANCSIRSQGQVRGTAAMGGSLSGYTEGA